MLTRIVQRTVAVFVFLLFASFALALDAAQLTILKATIQADPAWTSKSDSELAAWLNGPSVPAKIVWKTSVTREQIMENGFDWVRVDNLSVGKARIWEWMFESGAINPSKTNVQAGINEVWKGTAADLAVREAVYVHCRRTATRAEAALATGVGTTETPAVLTFEGSVSVQDVIDALTKG